MTRPVECIIAEEDQQLLLDTTTYATAYNAVAYRTIPILAFLFKDLVKPNPADKNPSVFKAGLFAALETATAPTSVVFNAVQVLAVGSFLVPPYFIRRSGLSDAQCRYAESMQVSPNTTQPLECYMADGYNTILNTNTAYAFGLALGVYLVMPVVFSAIPAWIKAYKNAGAGTEPVTPPSTPIDGVPIQTSISTLITEESAGFCNSLGNAFSQAMIAADKYALIDASQVTAILAFFAPLWGWVERADSKKNCKRILQNSTRQN